MMHLQSSKKLEGFLNLNIAMQQNAIVCSFSHTTTFCESYSLLNSNNQKHIHIHSIYITYIYEQRH